jgi:hypothetical protein
MTSVPFTALLFTTLHFTTEDPEERQRIPKTFLKNAKQILCSSSESSVVKGSDGC